ncbi:hypothetical protein EVAR_22882_1 [Eumeta japonica]|uniref:Uncharacterized protein n=1 Tax=Eumeta variegata TaxID=151549 RepID=A0A4C1UVH0_EUMVA|nr:hypothetical protein EVAR_22882_1 [Eumeta japonica]
MSQPPDASARVYVRRGNVSALRECRATADISPTWDFNVSAGPAGRRARRYFCRAPRAAFCGPLRSPPTPSVTCISRESSVQFSYIARIYVCAEASGQAREGATREPVTRRRHTNILLTKETARKLTAFRGERPRCANRGATAQRRAPAAPAPSAPAAATIKSLFLWPPGQGLSVEMGKLPHGGDLNTRPSPRGCATRRIRAGGGEWKTKKKQSGCKTSYRRDANVESESGQWPRLGGTRLRPRNGTSRRTVRLWYGSKPAAGRWSSGRRPLSLSPVPPVVPPALLRRAARARVRELHHATSADASAERKVSIYLKASRSLSTFYYSL